MQTLLRSLLVQNHSLNAFGVQPADVVIEPDVTGFDLAEFMRAKELAAIGEAAALEQIPKIRQLLARLDPQLFGSQGEIVVAHKVRKAWRGEVAMRSILGFLKSTVIGELWCSCHLVLWSSSAG